jgi:hypothetical protein
MDRFLESLISMMKEEEEASEELVVLVAAVLLLLLLPLAVAGDNWVGIAAETAAEAEVGRGVEDDDGEGCAGWGEVGEALCFQDSRSDGAKKPFVSHIVITWQLCEKEGE